MNRAIVGVFVATTLVLIGLAGGALSLAGIIDTTAARLFLVVGWFASWVGVATAEAFASKSRKHILLLTILTATITGVALYKVDKWIVSKKARDETASAVITGQSQSVNIAKEIAFSRNAPEKFREGEPILRRTKDGVVHCINPPTVAVLNYWPLTFNEPAEYCHDFPIIDVRHANGSFSRSIEDWRDGIQTKVGDELYVAVYINNGAANVGVDPMRVLARNVSVTINTDITVGATHYIDVTATGDNVETIYGRFKIQTNPNERLELIQKASRVFDSTGGGVLAQEFGAGNNTIKVGDLKPNFADSLFIVYKIKVVA